MAQYGHTLLILSTADVDERVTAFPTTWWIHNYIDNDALYPHLWALEQDADEDYVPRTTNAAESFHART